MCSIRQQVQIVLFRKMKKVEIEKLVEFDMILDVYRHIWIIKVVLCTGITHLHSYMDIFSILTYHLQLKHPTSQEANPNPD